jgi:adenosine deaminase
MVHNECVAPALTDLEWIHRLPKAEVHLHLEGCVDAAVVAVAAERHGATSPLPLDEGRPVLGGLAELLAYLDWSCALITEPDELATIAYESARRSSVSGTRHIDVIANPTHWPGFADRLGLMLDALDDGFRNAEADGFATATLCLSLKRQQSATEALHFVDWMIERRHRRVGALSIDGNEAAGSHNERFAEAFGRAGAAGLRRCAHAGESSGADGVREAIELLGAERIDHGIRALEDPAVVAELVRRSIPLDICPSSNVILGVVPSLAEHWRPPGWPSPSTPMTRCSTASIWPASTPGARRRSGGTARCSLASRAPRSTRASPTTTAGTNCTASLRTSWPRTLEWTFPRPGAKPEVHTVRLDVTTVCTHCLIGNVACARSVAPNRGAWRVILSLEAFAARPRRHPRRGSWHSAPERVGHRTSNSPGGAPLDSRGRGGSGGVALH